MYPKLPYLNYLQADRRLWLLSRTDLSLTTILSTLSARCPITRSLPSRPRSRHCHLRLGHPRCKRLKLTNNPRAKRYTRKSSCSRSAPLSISHKTAFSALRRRGKSSLAQWVSVSVLQLLAATAGPRKATHHHDRLAVGPPHPCQQRRRTGFSLPNTLRTRDTPIYNRRLDLSFTRRQAGSSFFAPYY